MEIFILFQGEAEGIWWNFHFIQFQQMEWNGFLVYKHLVVSLNFSNIQFPVVLKVWPLKESI